MRRVALTIGFQAEPRLQGWHLDAFFRFLADRYLSRQEVAPRPGADAGPYEFLPPDGGWPIPKTEFVGDDSSLSVQGDELEVVWDFRDNGTKKYPGFDLLAKELEQVLGGLVSSAQEHGVSITPREVGCFYINEIDGMTAAQLAVGVLTNWAEIQPRAIPVAGYVGVRLHDYDHTEENPCSSYVLVDSNDEGAPVLSFRVGRHLDEEEGAPEAVRQTHDAVIKLFRTHTPDELRARWGES